MTARVEISFYLEQGFFEEARGAVESLEETFRGDPRITELRSLVEAYTAGEAFRSFSQTTGGRSGTSACESYSGLAHKRLTGEKRRAARRCRCLKDNLPSLPLIPGEEEPPSEPLTAQASRRYASLAISARDRVWDGTTGGASFLGSGASHLGRIEGTSSATGSADEGRSSVASDGSRPKPGWRMMRKPTSTWAWLSGR